MLFCKDDFKENWLNFSNDFVIRNENAIYLGPNGIGKTTIYNIIKEKHQFLGFFSYDDCKDKILRSRKAIKISVRTVDIEKLNVKKQEILDNLDIKKNGFKKLNITSATKATNYSQYCHEVYNNNEKGILNFQDDKLDVLLNYHDDEKRKFILQNVSKLIALKLLGNEVKKIKDKFIIEAFDNLERALSEDETMCSLCGHDHGESVIKIYKERKKLFEDNLNELINNYRINSDKNTDQIVEDIKEMMEFIESNEVTDEDVVNYIIIGGDRYAITEILRNKTKIIKINEEIAKCERERNEFFKNLSNNWDKISKLLNKVFKDKIEFDIDLKEKVITLNLKRETKSYSVGELNYMVFLINILEFEYSNKSTIVIDDPLSSYDVKKQYEIVFDIYSRLINKNKTVIIFTHNINLINIVNSQKPKEFKYKSLEVVKNVVYVNEVLLPKTESILNIENLYSCIPNDNLKSWLYLLIKKDDWKSDCEKHKIFHYDEPYGIDKLGLHNDDLVKLIDDFDMEFPSNSFEIQSLYKIVYLTALRVWLEKRMLDNFDKEFKNTFNGKQLYPKIIHFFANKDKWIHNLDVKKENLLRKKVFLNQNVHYKSQIIPFHYVLSISCDDLVNEILELKELFKLPAEIR